MAKYKNFTVDRLKALQIKESFFFVFKTMYVCHTLVDYLISFVYVCSNESIIHKDILLPNIIASFFEVRFDD